MTIAPSRTRHSSAGFGVFASRTFQKSGVVESSYGSLVYYDLSSKAQTREVYEGAVLKVDVARFSRYVL